MNNVKVPRIKRTPEEQHQYILARKREWYKLNRETLIPYTLKNYYANHEEAKRIQRERYQTKMARLKELELRFKNTPAIVEAAN